MKKLISILAVCLLLLGTVGCGKHQEEQFGFGSIAFDGTTLEFPCKVQEMMEALPGVAVREEDVNQMVEPGATNFCNIFDYNNTSFGVMNLSDSAVSVKECDVVLVSTTISLSEQKFEVVYPGGVEYGKEYNEKKIVELLGEPVYTTESSVGETIQFTTKDENQGTYNLSVMVDEEGSVVGATLMMHPKKEVQVAEPGETVETMQTESVEESTEEQVDVESEEIIVETQEEELADAEDEAAGEQMYYVKLLSCGDNKVKAIMIYREHLELGLAEAKDAIDTAPCVILETTDLEKAQALAEAMKEIGAVVDEDMLSSEISVDVAEESDEKVDTEESAIEETTTEEVGEGFEGYETQVTLYNDSFKKRKVKMYTPVADIGVAMDIYVHSTVINDGNGYLIIGGQPSMGAPKCEDASNILEFYIEQAYERIDNTASASAFQLEITTKDEMTFNEHNMYKYTGIIQKSVSGTEALEYPFVAYATTAEDTSIFWLLADYSDNKDQMELLEKQALTMAESYTVE